LLKQRLSTSEIAIKTLKSVPSIKVARFRIRKKLSIPRSVDISASLNHIAPGFKKQSYFQL